MADYDSLVKRLRDEFDSRKTRPISWRKEQLKQLIKMHEEQADVFASALKEDLGKPRQEAFLTEIQFNADVATSTLNRLNSWASEESAEKSLVTMLDTLYCKYEPLGVVLIIGPWNYPLQLTLSPLISVIAAGNCAIVKPSELAPATSKALEELLPKYLDETCFKVVPGGVSETTELLKVRFDYIFFTGSLSVGKIVAEAASKYITPITVELGGKSPVYIHEDLARNDGKLKIAVKRLVWGKMMNAGQTCVAPDYIICHQGVRNKFIEMLKTVAKEFYEEDTNHNNIGRIISKRHFDRLRSMIDSIEPSKFDIKGEIDPDQKFIGFHVVQCDPNDSYSILKEEIFGPILPVLTVKNVESAIDIITRGPKPLSLYVFTENRSIQTMLKDYTSSGSVCMNDVVVQLSVESLPFGGVGDSGYGRYHGKYGFESFSHKKAVLIRDLGCIGENVGKFRYPPYSESKTSWGSFVIRPVRLPGPSFLKYGFCVLLGMGIAFTYNYIKDKEF